MIYRITLATGLSFGLSLAALAQSAAGNQSTANKVNAASQGVSLEQVLAATESAAGLENIKSAFKASSDSKTASQTRRFGATEAELEGSLSRPDAEKRLSVFITQPISIGFSKGPLEKAIASERDAEVAESMSQLQGEKLAVGSKYLELLYLQRFASGLKAMLAQSRTYFASTATARQSGSIDAVAAMKLKLLEKKLTSQLAWGASSFQTLASLLREATKLPIDQDFEKAALAPFSPGVAKDPNYLSFHPDLRSLSAKVESLEAKIRAESDIREIKVGAGIERSFSDGPTSLMARISYPIGQSFVVESAAKESRAQIGVTKAKLDQATNTLRRHVSFLNGEIKSKDSKVASLKSLQQEVALIQQTSVQGFSKGFVSIFEVVEATEQLFDVSSDLYQSELDYNVVALELRLIMESKYE